MLFPLLLLILAEVAIECLLAPGAVDRVGDGCKGRDGLVFAGVAEKLFKLARIHCFPLLPGWMRQEKETKRPGRKFTNQGERTMSTHAVTGDTDATRVQLRESSKDRLRQLLGDVAVHVVTVLVGSLGGVDVEAGAGAKVIRVVLALDVEAAF